MKKTINIFRAVVILTAYMLSACSAPGSQGAGAQGQFVEESQVQDVAYTGVIDAINGSQWTINGIEVTVEPSVVKGGPFIVGDTVKVEGMVNSDGGLVVVQVESPTAADLSDLPSLDGTADSAFDDNNNNSNANSNINGDDDDDDNTNSNANSNINGDDDDDEDDNTNLNANSNTNDDDDDDGNTNNNTNGDDDDDDDDDDSTNNTNNNTNDDDDDDDDDDENLNGS